jgi:hypothetical protein
VVQLPEVVGLVLCEGLDWHSARGKVSLSGVFQALGFRHFPTVPQDFTVYVALSGAVGEGALKLVITRLETDEEIYYYERWYSFPADRLLVVNIELPVRRCVFESPGRYGFTLYFDGKFVTERSLLIFKVKR